MLAFSNPLAEADKEGKKKKVDEGKKESQPKNAGSRKHKLGAFEEVLKIENQQKRSRRESWLAKGIVVKVMQEGKYHRKKGMVESIMVDFTAVVQMLDSKDKLTIDQLDLETVIQESQPLGSLCLSLVVSTEVPKKCLRDWTLIGTTLLTVLFR